MRYNCDGKDKHPNPLPAESGESYLREYVDKTFFHFLPYVLMILNTRQILGKKPYTSKNNFFFVKQNAQMMNPEDLKLIFCKKSLGHESKNYSIIG